MVAGLDTNVLVRYFVASGDDATERRQHEAAKQLLDAGHALRVCKTVLLELEWVLRGYYRYSRADIAKVLGYLLSQAHIDIEDRPALEPALANYAIGFDFADALHHASYADCALVASFDDRGFARRSRKFGLQPALTIPQVRREAVNFSELPQ